MGNGTDSAFFLLMTPNHPARTDGAGKGGKSEIGEPSLALGTRCMESHLTGKNYVNKSGVGAPFTI